MNLPRTSFAKRSVACQERHMCCFLFKHSLALSNMELWIIREIVFKRVSQTID